MMSRRTFIDSTIVFGSLGTWVAPGIWMTVLQPPHGPSKTIPLGVAFSGTITGKLSVTIDVVKNA